MHLSISWWKKKTDNYQDARHVGGKKITDQSLSLQTKAEDLFANVLLSPVLFICVFWYEKECDGVDR
jgi:hypothetical protein